MSQLFITVLNMSLTASMIEIATAVWLLGIFVILCYNIFSYFRLKSSLSTATLYKGKRQIHRQ